LVIGAGAIGCLVGGRLAADGHEVTLLGRERLQEAVSASGLQLQWPDGRCQIVWPAVVTDLAELSGPVAADLILVTVKAFDTAAAAQGLIGRVLPETCFLSLQNGVGNEARLAECFPDQMILAGSITLPVMVPQTGVIIVSKDKGGIGLAPYTDGAMTGEIAQTLARAGFSVAGYEDQRSLKWSKLLINIIGNATSAILDMPPGESLADQQSSSA
jgi:2-dehydropantoate 2-reductase